MVCPQTGLQYYSCPRVNMYTINIFRDRVVSDSSRPDLRPSFYIVHTCYKCHTRYCCIYFGDRYRRKQGLRSFFSALLVVTTVKKGDKKVEHRIFGRLYKHTYTKNQIYTSRITLFRSWRPSSRSGKIRR